MIVSNGIAILDRFFSFNFAGSLIAIYGVFFGIIITMLDGPGPCARWLNQKTLYYAKFLEFTWGRGALYFFVGTLQASNWNMLDWAVGGLMMFVGATAMGVGIAAARKLRMMKESIANERDLKRKWDQYDRNRDGKLDEKELLALTHDAGIDMSRNEIAAAFLALDKNYDNTISYEEFYSWWMADATYGGSASYAV
jgi:hypothetical protein